MQVITRRQFLSRLAQAGVAAVAAGALGNLAGCVAGGPRVERITIQAPASPPSIALARLIDNQSFAGLVEAAEFVLWKNPDEMRARISAGQAQLSGVPVNVAATLYNRGIPVQLLNVYIWGILYVISADAGVRSWEDLRGEELVVPFRGDSPDIVAQYLLQRQGLELGQEVRVRYVAAAPEAAGLLAAGQAQHAVLSEPSATLALLQAKEAGIELHRVIDMQADWGAVTGGPARLPLAGVVALRDFARTQPELVTRFQRAHAEAVDWVRDQPAEAVQLGSSYIPTMPAPAMAASLPFIQMEFVTAADARPEIEAHFNELSRLSPAMYGGALPGDDFYGLG
jgi:NitT/TauT family transport system substrate-binding protein